MKKRKIMAILIMATVTMASGLTAHAVTPQYHSWVPDIPNITWDSLSDESKDVINGVVDDVINSFKLDKPVVTESIYRHERVFWDPERLQINWNEVDGAEYYKVKVIKKDGSYKIYETKSTTLSLKKGSDDFITSCVRSGSVQVMACNDNGFNNSDWSDKKTISCNALHGYRSSKLWDFK